MKTTTDYEKTTDWDLDEMVAEAVGLGCTASTFNQETGNLMKHYKSYATDLNACREAIEKFCIDSKCQRVVKLDCYADDWEAIVVPFTEDGDCISSYMHENPARAACIAMLKALEKEKE